MITLYNNNGELTINTDLQLTKFPGGENHIKTPEGDYSLPNVAYITGAAMDDYMWGAQWANMCQQAGIKTTAVIPYLPGARQDRGTPLGAKNYADLINAAGYDRVICFDPHSAIMPEMINNLITVYSDTLIKKALPAGKYVGVIAPDAGAVKRTEKVAATLGLPMFKATKVRDFQTGELSGFQCETVPTEGRLLVVDDICDGGYTFRGLAEVINTPRENLSLWVSHGVFSGQADALNEQYSVIYTTDSHPGATREDVGANITPLLQHLLEEADN